MKFKKLNYRLVYEYIKRHEGEEMPQEKIRAETGLGLARISAALKYLRVMNFIDEESPMKYFITPESLTN